MQKARMVESFIFLKEKKDGTLKAQTVLGGNVQQELAYSVHRGGDLY